MSNRFSFVCARCQTRVIIDDASVKQQDVDTQLTSLEELARSLNLPFPLCPVSYSSFLLFNHNSFAQTCSASVFDAIQQQISMVEADNMSVSRTVEDLEKRLGALDMQQEEEKLKEVSLLYSYVSLFRLS